MHSFVFLHDLNDSINFLVLSFLSMSAYINKFLIPYFKFYLLKRKLQICLLDKN